MYEVVCTDNEEYLLGDLNFDDDINVLDVVMLVNFILDVSVPDEIELNIADMNDDSTLNVQDIIILINIILGNI